MKVISPLLGFNNNVKHKGRVFHIQTEDSGMRHPHVITHLFADGGRILKTLKTSYAEHLNDANVQEVVRGLMKEQHKAMFVALRDGQFDHIFEDAAPAEKPAPAPAPAPEPVAAAPEPTPAPAPVVPAAPAAAPQIVPQPPAPPSLSVPKSLPKGPIPSVTMPAVAAGQAAPASGGVELDLAQLEQSAKAVETQFVAQTQNLPSPPASIKKGGAVFTADVYRALNAPEPGQPSPPPSAGRYAPSRPPAFFATARPAQGTSIFGEDLISEKSLDEVILSYLAEDLDGGEGA